MEEKIEVLIKENEELKEKLTGAHKSIKFCVQKYNDTARERDMMVFAIRKIVSGDNNNKSI